MQTNGFLPGEPINWHTGGINSEDAGIHDAEIHDTNRETSSPIKPFLNAEVTTSFSFFNMTGWQYRFNSSYLSLALGQVFHRL